MRIVNEASPNKMTYIENQAITTVPLDLDLIELYALFNNDAEFINHLNNVLGTKFKVGKK